MSNLIKILVGFVTIFIILTLFTGPSAIILVAASIICTAGVGLVIWIPLSFVVGSVVIAIFQSIHSASLQSGNAEKSTGPKLVVLTNEQKAIIDYIKLARVRGFKDDDTYTNLKIKGWTEQVIRECFARVESKTY